jgi:hypothetical protein
MGYISASCMERCPIQSSTHAYAPSYPCVSKRRCLAPHVCIKNCLHGNESYIDCTERNDIECGKTSWGDSTKAMACLARSYDPMRNQTLLHIRYCTHINRGEPLLSPCYIDDAMPRDILTGAWAFATNWTLLQMYQTIAHYA